MFSRAVLRLPAARALPTAAAVQVPGLSSMVARSFTTTGAPGHTFKRADRGIYGTAHVQTGNNVSFSQRKTKRRWLPNAQRVSLWSDILDTRVSVRATARMIRTIERAGGLDRWILHTPSAKLTSQFVLNLKKRILSAQSEQQAAAAAAAAEGVTVEAWLAAREQARLSKPLPAAPGVTEVLPGQEATVEGVMSAKANASGSGDVWMNMWDEDELAAPEAGSQRAWRTAGGRTLLLTPQEYSRRTRTMDAMRRKRTWRVGC